MAGETEGCDTLLVLAQVSVSKPSRGISGNYV
jgi:hypothetical protein